MSKMFHLVEYRPIHKLYKQPMKNIIVFFAIVKKIQTYNVNGYFKLLSMKFYLILIEIVDF